GTDEIDKSFAFLEDLGALGLRQPPQGLELEAALPVDVPGGRDETVDEDRRQYVAVFPNHRAAVLLRQYARPLGRCIREERRVPLRQEADGCRNLRVGQRARGRSSSSRPRPSRNRRSSRASIPARRSPTRPPPNRS